MKNIKIFILLSFVIFLSSCYGCQKSEKTEPETVEAVIDLSDTGIVMTGITAVAFSADDLFFAAGTAEGSLMIWDITRSRRVRAIKAGEEAVTSAAFSADGRYAAVTLSSGEIKMWDYRRNETGNTEAVLVQNVRENDIPIFADFEFEQNNGILQVKTESGQKNIKILEKITAAALN